MMIVIITLVQLIMVFILVYQMRPDDKIRYAILSAELSRDSLSNHDLQYAIDRRILMGRLQSGCENVVALKIKLDFADAVVRQQTANRDALCGCLRRSVACHSINFGADTLSTMATNPIDDNGDYGDSHSVQYSNGDPALGRRNWRDRSGFQQATPPSTCDASSYNHC